MTTMRKVIKPEIVSHLEMVQRTIDRMAHVSFLLKGWTVTITVAGLGFALSSKNPWLALLTLFPVLVLAGLDAYYLRQERLFRSLFNKIRLSTRKDSVSPFCMDTGICKDAVEPCHKTLLRPTICWFYGTTGSVCVIVFMLTLF